MRSIFFLLLAAPPCLATLSWFMSRGWTALMMQGRTTERIQRWQRYDFWVFLIALYVVMISATAFQHKLLRSKNWPSAPSMWMCRPVSMC